MKLTDTKILLSNYPNIRQEVPFGQVGGNETIDIQCGYDIKVDAHQVTLQIASDLITAIRMIMSILREITSGMCFRCSVQFT